MFPDRVCKECHQRKPIEEVRRNAYGPTGYCKTCFDAIMQRAYALRRAQRAQERPAASSAPEVRAAAPEATPSEGVVTVHAGYGVRYKETAVQRVPPAPPPAPPAPPAPPPSAPAPSLLETLRLTPLDDWLTAPAVAAHGEAFLIPLTDGDGAPSPEGALLIWRSGATYYLLSGAPERWPTPDEPIAPETLRYIIHVKTGARSHDEVLGVRFA